MDDNYGGIYLNDTGSITVLVNQDSFEVKNKIKKLTSHPKDVTFKKVKYSKKQLNEAKNRLEKDLIKSKSKLIKEGKKDEILSSIKAWGIDIKGNKLNVAIPEKGNEDDTRKVLETLVEPEMISIGVMGDIIDQYSGKIASGNKITDGAGYCTNAFYGKVSGSSLPVMVTAGHCQQLYTSYKKWYYPTYSTSNLLGSYGSRTSGSTGSDAGYIYAKDVNVSTVEKKTGLPIGQFDIIGTDYEGTNISVSAPSASSLINGTVEHIFNIDVGGSAGYNVIYDVRLTTASSTKGGDSGAPVLRKIWNASKQRYEFMLHGIHKGIVPYNGVNYEVYSKAGSAYNNLGLTSVYLAP